MTTTTGLVMPQKLEAGPSNTATYGKFIAEPFERGYGHTVGHALRRILLSSLEGSAVTAVRIKGAPHEFSSLKGVQEDAINILLNLKKVRFRLNSDGPETLSLKVKKSGPVKAKDFDDNASVEILTPDQVIARLDGGAELDMEIEVSRGRGYVPAERLKREGQPVNTIPLDALFSPVQKAHYEVENARVGQMTDYDRLIIEVWTDGSVTPEASVTKAAGIMRDTLRTFLPASEAAASAAPAGPAASAPQTSSRVKDLLTQPVDIIELSVRASNCLKAAKIKTINELVSKSEEELLNFKNFGKKSLDEIVDRLKELGLSLSMEIKA
jgi:DNA-directed RNA polymerase subunit alpha